jgi:hypothetical protein
MKAIPPSPCSHLPSVRSGPYFSINLRMRLL